MIGQTYQQLRVEPVDVGLFETSLFFSRLNPNLMVKQTCHHKVRHHAQINIVMKIMTVITVILHSKLQV